MRFKEIVLADLPVFEKILSRHPQRICCFTPQALFAWRNVYQYQWSLPDPDTFFVSFETLEDEGTAFFQPAGPFSAAAQEKVLGLFREMEYPGRIFNVGEEFLAEHPAFVKQFDVIREDGLVNYIYNTQDLALLRGAAYEKKRNMIANARKLYQWTAEPVTPGDRSALEEILLRWQKSYEDHDIFRDNEALAAGEAIRNFAELSYRGVLIRVDDRPAAFSLFARLNPGTAGINFMKADKQYRGLSEIIHQETAKAIDAAGYPLINLEEDWDIPGLRRNKQSYRPAELIPSYILEFRL